MTRDNFHAKLDEAEAMVQEMGTIIYDLMTQLIAVYRTHELSADIMDKLLREEAKLDHLEYSIEKLSMEQLALQQPMAVDLRTIICILKMSMDLERIGDHIRKIIRKTRKVITLKQFTHFVPLTEMTLLLRQMIDQIMVALKERNIRLVKSTLAIDEQINDLQRNLFQRYIEDMKTDPNEGTISSGIYLLFITRFLERIGDHVENIGERVNYLVTGDIRKLKHPHYDNYSIEDTVDEDGEGSVL